MPLRKYITILFLIAVVLVCASGTVSYNNAYTVKWVVLKDCTVRVNGSTNINKFSCSIPDYQRADTLTCNKNSQNDIAVNMSGRLSLPVFSFDCMNIMMTKDLRKTLKVKEFPTLNIYFISLEKYPQLNTEEESIAGIVSIVLAGVAKRIAVNFKFSMNEQKIIHLVGNQSIRFSDFNLTPPRKLGGMIRADDRLDVIFHLNFRKIDG